MPEPDGRNQPWWQHTESLERRGWSPETGHWFRPDRRRPHRWTRAADESGWRDPRRAAQGDDITYIWDVTEPPFWVGPTDSGLSSATCEAEIDASFTTWDTEQCLTKVNIVKRADPGSDITIFDSFFGFGGFGDPFAADIVEAGFYPQEYFDAVACGIPFSNCGCGILAFSVSFTFTGTDLNGDNYLDTALNEVYYNDDFGPNSVCGFSANPWTTGQMALPAVDVQTVALHENGHSLGIGHFGPPPAAIMNPSYGGPLISPLPIDNAGMCAVWASWPNP